MEKRGLGTKALGSDLAAGVVTAVTAIPDALGSATQKALRAATRWLEEPKEEGELNAVDAREAAN